MSAGAGARRLSAAGAGALAVFVVPRAGWPEGADLRDAEGRGLAAPAPGRWRRARLHRAGRLVDDVLVLGRADALEVHAHGGAAVAEAVGCVLGVPPDDDGAPSAAWPASLRAARALASAEHGPLAALLDALRVDAARARRERARELARACSLLDFGARLARPPLVRLVGRPNAGKSTLLNRLVGRPRALVAARAGTTRDAVEAELRLAGVPVRVQDTAGAEPGASPAAGERADLLVHLLGAPDEPLWAAAAAHEAAPVLRVLGRADERPAGPGPRVSGLTGQGVAALGAAMAAALGLDRPAADDLWAALRPADRCRLEAATGG